MIDERLILDILEQIKNACVVVGGELQWPVKS